MSRRQILRNTGLGRDRVGRYCINITVKEGRKIADLDYIG